MTQTAVAGTLPELRHEYTPYGGAKRMFHCRDLEVLLVGAAGTGKSLGCMEKLNYMALLNPGMRGLIVRKTLVSLGSTALVTWRKSVIPELLESGGVSFFGGSPQEQAGYRYHDNGSFIAIGGMDKPEKVMSSEYDIIYVQEATDLNLEDWEALISRLRNWQVSFQQILADCNPNVPTHWLKARADRGAVTAITSRHTDNPMLYFQEPDPRAGQLTEAGETYVRKTLGALTGVRKLRLLDGLWAAAEGLIYSNWDPEVHHIAPFEIPSTWRRVWGIDWGYTNPFVCGFWAIDPDGRMFLYREVYMSRQLVEDHAKTILDLVSTCMLREKDIKGHKCRTGPDSDCRREWHEPKPSKIVGDHDAEDRATFEKHAGLYVTPANKGKAAGIQHVESRLKIQPDGRARLYIFRDALVKRDPELELRKKPTSTPEEIVGYQWAKTAAGFDKETPEDVDNHGMDQMRYVATELDTGIQVGIRTLRTGASRGAVGVRRR